MTVYGSDNPDCVAIDHLGDVLRTRPTSSKWKKVALATAGTALCLGGALVIYDGWSPLSGASLASTILESNAVSATSTDETNLKSGKEILLRVRGKDNLCADDGGSTKADDTRFTAQPCNPNNPNQLFVYDTSTYQFKSARKSKLCLDDGGGWAGVSKVRLSKCDSKSEDQRYQLEPSTLLLKNPSKQGYCLHDGGGNTAGSSQFTFWGCSDKNDNEHFEVLSQATLAEEHNKVLDAVANGSKFILRMAGTRGLCAFGDDTAVASTSFGFEACDKQSAKQLFSYDASIDRVRSSEKTNLCLDDGGGKTASKTDVRLAKCSPASLDQSFNFNTATLQVYQPNKAGLCLDDGDDKWLSFAAPKLILRTCDPYSPYQHFELVLQSEPVTATPAASAALVTTYQATTMEPVMEPTTTVAAPGTTEQESTMEGPGIVEQVSTLEEPGMTAHKSTMEAPSMMEPTTVMEPEMMPQTSIEEPGMMSTTAMEEPGMTEQESTMEEPSMMEPTTAMEPEMMPQTSIEEPGMMSTTAMEEPGMTEQESTMEEPSMMEPTTAMEPEMMPQTSIEEPGMMSTTAMEEPGMTKQESAMEEPSMMEPTTAMEPEMVTQTTSEDVSAELPDQESELLPPNNEPVVNMPLDMPLAHFGDQDWNLLAPSEQTINLVNADNAPDVPAAKIFQYLQSLKDQAEVEYNIMMYRYKRTYQCASAGLQTLAQDSVTTDEYHVLVRWMYEHCAAGNTEIAPPLKPMPPLPKDAVDATDVAPLVNDTASDVKRQYMTKMDFYYEIKNHFAQKSETMMGNAAEVNLHLMMTKEQEKTLIDCIDASSERFGYVGQDNASVDPKNHLKEAIAWVEDSCMKA